MFNGRYFAIRYFTRRYWCKVGASPAYPGIVLIEDEALGTAVLADAARGSTTVLDEPLGTVVIGDSRRE